MSKAATAGGVKTMAKARPVLGSKGASIHRLPYLLCGEQEEGWTGKLEAVVKECSSGRG